MKSIKRNLLSVVKASIDKDVNAGNELSSRCVAILFQPNRKQK